MAGASPEISLQAFSVKQARVRLRIEWFDRQIMAGMNIEFEKRIDILAQLIRDKIVANLSLPVERGAVVKRSKPREFPRAETTRLMRDIFWDRSSRLKRIVGTSLDYGLYLELKERSFLRRTLDEERSLVESILTRRMN